MEDLEREMLLIAQGNELAFNSFMNRYMDGLYYHSYGILYNKETVSYTHLTLPTTPYV